MLLCSSFQGCHAACSYNLSMLQGFERTKHPFHGSTVLDFLDANWAQRRPRDVSNNGGLGLTLARARAVGLHPWLAPQIKVGTSDVNVILLHRPRAR